MAEKIKHEFINKQTLFLQQENDDSIEIDSKIVFAVRDEMINVNIPINEKTYNIYWDEKDIEFIKSIIYFYDTRKS